ncbi:hypothetical protein MBLNU457_7732t1 [Dothideomycetes sp. NU457]
MAYNRAYTGNPDALPAHAEPEQAAQMLAASQRPSSGSYNRPPPPAPVQGLRHDDRYSQAPPSKYNQAPPSNYNQPPPQPNRYSSSQPPAPPSRDNYASPPPPSSYGTGPRPAPPASRPTIPQSQRPPTAAPRNPSDRDSLWPLFIAVDRDRTGQLSEDSLRRALVNGDYTAFDPHTVKMMIRMFDADRSGTINFDEFCGLWGFLSAWRNLFDRFDVDRSGHISLSEFSEALVAFGYRLSAEFVRLLFGTFCRNVGGRGDDGRGGGREKGLSFDLFVQACISLKRMTDVFKRFDEDRDGYITLSL